MGSNQPAVPVEADGPPNHALHVVGHQSAEELVDLIRLEVFRSRAIASDRTEQGGEPEDPASAGEIARRGRMSPAVTGAIARY